jgi:hypothetical protein
VTPDEPFVITFYTPPARQRLMLAGVPVLAVVAIVVMRSLFAIVLGALMLVLSVWFVAILLVDRRVRAGRSNGIVVTREGLRAPGWSLAWDRVAGVTVQSRTGGPALVIEPYRSSDIERAPSWFLGLNARANDVFRLPQIMIPLRILERPLEEVLRQLEEKAGRTFR